MADAQFISDLAACLRVIGKVFLPLAHEELIELDKRLVEFRVETEARLAPHLEGLSESHPLLSPIDLFKVLALDRREVAHTAMLARLLDPQGGHGLGTALLAGLLRDQVPGTLKASSVQVDPEHRVRSGPHKGRRIDVLATGQMQEGERWALAIEAKISEDEQPGQLKAYRKYLKQTFKCKTVLIFLTVDGHVGRTDSFPPWIPMTYIDLAFLIRDSIQSVSCPETKRLIGWYWVALLRWFGGCELTPSPSEDSNRYTVSNPYAASNVLLNPRWRQYGDL